MLQQPLGWTCTGVRLTVGGRPNAARGYLEVVTWRVVDAGWNWGAVMTWMAGSLRWWTAWCKYDGGDDDDVFVHVVVLGYVVVADGGMVGCGTSSIAFLQGVHIWWLLFVVLFW